MAGEPTVFDDLFRLVTPDRLLRDPRATGAGVRVGVVDSGVERSVIVGRHGDGVAPIQGAVFRPDSPQPLPYDGRQSGPHGTVVADIILTLAPRAELYSADVFGPAGGTDVDTVIRALRHAIDVWGCHVVNLSLGVPESRLTTAQRQQFWRAVEDAYYRDVLVIAAASNDHPLTKSYPAALAPPLISVNKGVFPDPLQFAYVLDHAIEFQAHGRGYLGLFTREPATSWAAPHLAGIAARLLSLRPGMKPFEVKTLLYWLSRPAEATPG